MLLNKVTIGLLCWLLLSCELPKSSSFDGIYIVKLKANSSSNHLGEFCGTSSGTLIIKNNLLSGTLVDQLSLQFQVTGFIEEDNKINGEIYANNFVRVAKFNGVMSYSNSSGDWQNEDKCFGTWNLKEK